MKNAGPEVEIALDLLANATPFIIVADESLVVTWASLAVLKRVDGMIGMSIADSVARSDLAMDVACQLPPESVGQIHRFTLRQDGSAIPLVGRWLPCRDGFLLLATPDPRTSEDLSLFCLEDFPAESRIIELFAGRDETYASLKAAASASAMLTAKIRELNVSRRHLESVNAAMENEIADRRHAEEAMKDAERMLQQSLAHQEALLGAVPDILMEVDRNKVYTWANWAGIEFFGQDVVGRAAGDYFDGEQNVYELVQPLFDGDADVICVESWQRRRDGQKRLLAWRCRAIKDGEGHTVGVMSSARDITEQRQVEEKLRISEERYRVLFEGSRDAIMTIEPSTWRFTSGNPTAVKMFGAETEEEFTTLRPADLSPERQPDGRSSADKAREMIETAVREGSRFFEWTHRRITGEVFPANVLLAKMESEGKVIIQATVRNITERKQMEQVRERFLQRQERLNRLQETLLAPSGLTQKLKMITDAVVDIFQADFCRIWCIGTGDLCEEGCMHALATEGPHVCRHKDKCLRLLASSGRYTHTDGVTHRRVPFGAYKIGRVASGQDHKFLTNDVVHDSRVHNHDWARELGLVSFAGYQIRPPGGETLGVLALFSKHALSSEEDAQLDSLSSTTARVIQSAQFEETLCKNEERYRTVAEHTYDWEYWLTPDGKFAYCSPSCERISGYRSDEYCSDPNHHRSEPEGFLTD